MDEILDEIPTENTREIYSKLSLIFSMLALIFLLILSYNTIGVDHNITGISTNLYVVFGIFLFTFPVGIVMKIMSFVNKESANRFRQLGFFFSAAVVCFLFVLIYFDL